MFNDILNTMKSIVIFFSLMVSAAWFLPPLQAAEQPVAVIGAEFWSMPRHADQLLAQTPLQAAVQQLWVEPESYLILHYPNGESGEVWGLELQAWLVSLGVTSDRIELRAGYERDDAVAVIMVAPDVEVEPEAEIDQIEAQTIEQNSSETGSAAVMPAAVQDEVELQ